MKRNSWKRYLATATFLLLAWIFPACATTTIQTGGNQYHPRDFAKRGPEERFFTEMSEQDEALQKRSAQNESSPTNDEITIVSKNVTKNTDKNCPCDNTVEPQKRSVRLDEYIGDTKEDDSPRYHKEAVAQETDTQKTTPVSSTEGLSSNSGKYPLSGTASWYGRDFDGKPTASGEIFDSRKLTAAHKTIPLGSIVLVRNLENNKEILVTINDRGPYVGDRILDVSEYGAELLGYKEQGLTQVELKIIRLGKGKGSAHGATYNFFGSSSESGSMGAGDDPKANREIDHLLSREAVEPESEVRRQASTALMPEYRQSGYAVQIGVFDDLRNARQLKRYLQRSSAKEAEVRIYKRKGRQYVVKIGEFADRNEADIWKTRMIQEGYHAFVSKPN